MKVKKTRVEFERERDKLREKIQQTLKEAWDLRSKAYETKSSKDFLKYSEKMREYEALYNDLVKVENELQKAVQKTRGVGKV